MRVGNICPPRLSIDFASLKFASASLPAGVIATTMDGIKSPGSKDVEDAGATWENPALVN